MAHGIVTWFDQGRGFGFISRAGFVSRDDGGAEVFVHRGQISGDGSRRLGRGDRVSFTLRPHAAGLRAADVRQVG
ncbi:CspA family cold shock protein [Tamaricihabitans halophyticus]|uniref:CspA family cold shock protein n=1 Tax=Tamaricihabitans halophyticus TaxID=1262583 RepID=A0A4R2QMS0_9PSEU|nr:cold shock domain-containing protein [Tamaricihabitans halophyticus]TCP50862.1 CspA family cold shock protein [Tamaricihabitans halophyticus]